MRTFVPAIYDSTVAIPKSSPVPTMLRMFKGQFSVRHLMSDLPENDEAIAQWCKDIFVAKVCPPRKLVILPESINIVLIFLRTHNLSSLDHSK
nr:1-acyl-sn-glycerol-3-phosphate acyltransferase 2 [Ipomoea batatas]